MNILGTLQISVLPVYTSIPLPGPPVGGLAKSEPTQNLLKHFPAYKQGSGRVTQSSSLAQRWLHSPPPQHTPSQPLNVVGSSSL